MGNITNGLKIKKIGKDNVLNGITYGSEEKILEYICYIIRINERPINQNYQVIEQRNNYIVHNFSLFNILTKKEYKIKLESTNNKLFFLNLEVELCTIPNVEKVLLISNVIENSIAMSLKIKQDSYILLGDHYKFFDKMEDISEAILEKKANFIFFNFKKKKIKHYNFETFRIKENEFMLGLECELLSIESFFKQINDETVPIMDQVILTSSNHQIEQNDANNFVKESESTSYDNMNENKISENTNIITQIEDKQTIHLIKEEDINNVVKTSQMFEVDLIFENNSTNLNSIFKYSLKKPKVKIMKNLKIYENLDSHFNFLGPNYKKDSSESTSINQKSVILIKGFSLLNIEEGQISNSILSINNLYNNLKMKFFQYIF
jgi:hypothetical protein